LFILRLFRISSKVDVWSVGVIFFQMLFGIRPFGEGKSQEVIWKEKTLLTSNRVEFPQGSDKHPQPKISDEAKDFIRCCLEPDHIRRLVVVGSCFFVLFSYFFRPLSFFLSS
jgi:tousled-like kinase